MDFCSRTFLSLIFTSSVILSGCSRHLEPIQSIEVAAKGLHSAAISEDASLSVIGSIHHGGSLWRHEDGERLFNWNHETEEPSTLVAMDFSDDGRWALTAATHTLVLWNTGTGRAERFWTAPAEVLDVELDAEGRLALLGLSDHSAVIFDVRRGGIRRVFQHQNRVRSVDFSRDRKYVLTGSEDYTAALWEAESGKLISKIKHEDDVQLVRLSDDGKLALSVSKYDKAIIWRSEDAQKIAEVPLKAEHIKRGTRFTSARFSSDNLHLLTGRPDQLVQLWSVPDYDMQNIDEKNSEYTLEELARWRLPKRSAWKPTGAAVLDVAFGLNNTSFWALASNGYLHKLSNKENVHAP